MYLLHNASKLSTTKILNHNKSSQASSFQAGGPVLIVLAAGKGTRFGTDPKCIQPVAGIPLARRSIDAFSEISQAPAICIVGYRHEEVATALGDENIYVHSDNPTGGTGFAAFEAFCAPELLERNPLVVITMGDRIVPAEIYQVLWEMHCQGTKEATLTMLTAQYEPPRNLGKGRILRSEDGNIIAIREQKDIDAEPDSILRAEHMALTEGNCPLYMIRARTLHALLKNLTNDNAQQQYYLTDIVDAIIASDGEVRSITTKPGDPAYALLCADVTHADDLAKLEQIVLNSAGGF